VLKLLKKIPAVFAHIYTMFIVMLGWALFYFEDMGALGGFFVRAFTVTGTSIQGINLILAFLPLLAVTVFAATPAAAICWKKLRQKSWAGYAAIAAAAVILLLCVATLASQSYNPFIYFRF